LPGLSPIAEVVARFDGGRLSSDGGLLLLRDRTEARGGRASGRIEDRRDPASTVHTLADIIRFRLLMIAAS
jgi:DDE family transposase